MGMWSIPQDPEPVEQAGSEEEISAFIETLAEAVVRRGMSVPVILALEMGKPLSFVGYNAMTALAPLLEIIVAPAKMAKLTAVVGDRRRIERLLVAIEEHESRLTTRGKEEKPRE
jgi:hypothetical protein